MPMIIYPAFALRLKKECRSCLFKFICPETIQLKLVKVNCLSEFPVKNESLFPNNWETPLEFY
jgi:hypothetical protein